MARALTIPFPVSGWIGPDGKVWRENTIITVVSDILSIPDGFDFLIRSVEFNISQNGQSAILGLLPPQVYTKEQVGDPWVQ